MPESDRLEARCFLCDGRVGWCSDVFPEYHGEDGSGCDLIACPTCGYSIDVLSEAQKEKCETLALARGMAAAKWNRRPPNRRLVHAKLVVEDLLGALEGKVATPGTYHEAIQRAKKWLSGHGIDP